MKQRVLADSWHFVRHHRMFSYPCLANLLHRGRVLNFNAQSQLQMVPNCSSIRFDLIPATTRNVKVAWKTARICLVAIVGSFWNHFEILLGTSSNKDSKGSFAEQLAQQLCFTTGCSQLHASASLTHLLQKRSKQIHWSVSCSHFGHRMGSSRKPASS